MTNAQARLFATILVMLVGVLAIGTDNLDFDVGFIILLVGSVLFVVEYIRAQRG